jgi:hypothetical protein
LQTIIEERLKIKGMPSNLIPLPSLNALVGAYVAWKAAVNEDLSEIIQIGTHKNIPVISAINLP